MSLLKRVALALYPAMTGGAFLALGAIRAGDPSVPRIGCLFLGATAGALTLGLIWLFPVRGWGRVVAGFFAGNVAPGLLMTVRTEEEDRGGFWFVFVLLGVLIGLLEWARDNRRLSRTDD